MLSRLKYLVIPLLFLIIMLLTIFSQIAIADDGGVIGGIISAMKGTDTSPGDDDDDD